MKVAVVGLGIEGKNAVNSLLNYGYQVYATDIEIDLELEFDDYENEFEIDLGSHDWDRINEADAIVISPSLWKPAILERITSKKKFLSDVLNQHRSIFTIGVTGTNGKTTTCLMIQDILKNAGFKVLIGGNAGGGFEGYTQIMLEASSSVYDFLIVEVCDMTLDFCLYNFDFDLLVVTNLGYDHINVHGSMENYQNKLQEFIQNKKAILNVNDESSCALADFPRKTYFFDFYPGELKLFGNFNRQNAAAAAKVAEILEIPEKNIIKSLSSFDPVVGRTAKLKYKKTDIIIGKTDNISALAAVLNEIEMDAVLLGTPREKEYWRFNIFKEVTRFNPQFVGLFSGLENTTTQAAEILRENSYHGPVKVFDDISGVIDFIINHHMNFHTIFIGGNGQDKLIEIRKRLDQIS